MQKLLHPQRGCRGFDPRASAGLGLLALALLAWLVLSLSLSSPLRRCLVTTARPDRESQPERPGGRSPHPGQRASHGTAKDADIKLDPNKRRSQNDAPRVLVWVMTSPDNAHRATAVMETWGSRARKGLLWFVSSASHDTNTSLPVIRLSVEEGRSHLTAKTMRAFDYIHRHFFHTADFFMKVDDDTYVVLENLQYFLAGIDPYAPFIAGRHFLNKARQSFLSGGAGYVLSKGALDRLANRKKKPPLCAEDGIGEDVNLGRCLSKLNVPILNSSDSRGRSRFHAYPPVAYLDGSGLPSNYRRWDANTVRLGSEAISEYPISFHYISHSEMRMLHFLLYHVKTYRIKSDKTM